MSFLISATNPGVQLAIERAAIAVAKLIALGHTIIDVRVRAGDPRALIRIAASDACEAFTSAKGRPIRDGFGVRRRMTVDYAHCDVQWEWRAS